MTEQERQFADLVGRWTHDISALAAERRRRAADIESRRTAALAAVPGAAAILFAWDGDKRKAAATHDETIRRAEAALADKAHELDVKAATRRDEAVRAQQEADAEALADRDRAVRDATAKRDARLAEIDKLPFAQQVPLRREADAAYHAAVTSARAAYDASLIQDHETMQAKQRRAGDEARAAREEASDERLRAVRDAEASLRAAVAAADVKKMDALAAIPAAAAVNATFDAEVSALDADCRAREAAMLEEFRRQRAALGIPEHDPLRTAASST